MSSGVLLGVVGREHQCVGNNVIERSLSSLSGLAAEIDQRQGNTGRFIQAHTLLVPNKRFGCAATADAERSRTQQSWLQVIEVKPPQPNEHVTRSPQRMVL